MDSAEKMVYEDEKLSYRTPIYLQLREIIRNRIEEGEYLPGTAIPSENKLAETYGINRLTVRNAVDTLVNEGVLQRVQGKGVFVVGDKYEENLEEHGGFVSMLGCDYWDSNGRAIAYSRSFIRSDRSSFTIRLHD